jgi:Helix-turn-helix domain
MCSTARIAQTLGWRYASRRHTSKCARLKTMNSNPLKCVLDVRSVPPERFALPIDGRQRKHLCVQRQRLINLLATYANPDGTNCWPSRDTLAAALGQGVRTIARLLDDLETLGYMESKGLHGLRGPRIKNLNIATITSVQSSDAGVPSSQVGVPSSKVDVPSSKAGVPSTFVLGSSRL